MENYVPQHIPKWFQLKPHIIAESCPQTIVKKGGYPAFLDYLPSLCFSPSFLSLSSTIILPSSGDSAPLRCLRDFLSRRECISSPGKKGKAVRESDMELSSFLYLVTASACWSQPRNMERGALENRGISCFTPESNPSPIQAI